MNRWLGTTICWLLRHHAWRRLRKAEAVPVALKTFRPPEDWTRLRICSRCGATRIARQRKAKA